MKRPRGWAGRGARQQRAEGEDPRADSFTKGRDRPSCDLFDRVQAKRTDAMVELRMREPVAAKSIFCQQLPGAGVMVELRSEGGQPRHCCHHYL